MDEEEHQSLEYEEDCYYSAPSFEPSWTDDEEAFCIAEEELCSVETEFRRKPDSVKVTFQDLSKPYLPRVSSPTNYRRFLQLVKGSVVLARMEVVVGSSPVDSMHLEVVPLQ